jgi:hypothetical protein
MYHKNIFKDLKNILYPENEGQSTKSVALPVRVMTEVFNSCNTVSKPFNGKPIAKHLISTLLDAGGDGRAGIRNYWHVLPILCYTWLFIQCISILTGTCCLKELPPGEELGRGVCINHLNDPISLLILLYMLSSVDVRGR